MLKNKISFIKVLVTAFPLSLMVMGIGSLFLYEQRRVDKHEEQPFSTPIETKRLAEYHQKLTDFMSPRGFEKPLQTNLLRTCAFIEGSLSGVNTGMNIYSVAPLTKNGRIWKDFLIKYEGDKSNAEDIELITINYVNGSNTEIAVGLAIGEALPGLDLQHSIHMHFTPSSSPSVFSSWDTSDWDVLSKRAEEFIKERLVTPN